MRTNRDREYYVKQTQPTKLVADMVLRESFNSNRIKDGSRHGTNIELLRDSFLKSCGRPANWKVRLATERKDTLHSESAENGRITVAAILRIGGSIGKTGRLVPTQHLQPVVQQHA